MWPPVREQLSMSAARTSLARARSSSRVSGFRSAGTLTRSRTDMDTGAKGRSVEVRRSVARAGCARTSVFVYPASGLPLHDEAREALQRGREQPRGGQRLARLTGESVRAPHRALHAEQGGIGALAEGGVASSRLSELRGGGGGVEH